uniref:Putative salivary secreted protein splice variant n=1 Tax=Oncopeltus fasciatus TaxID=7536 RepID=A3FK25_ONCFA|nr:putative salivary secreted protein precursor splice variant [Oncopeltus fasciatus]
MSAVVLLLAASGVALGFTDLLRAGTNAARGSLTGGTSLLGQNFGRRQNGQQNGASGGGVQGRPKPNGQQSQASSNTQQEPLTLSSPPVESRNEDISQSLGSSSLLGSAISSARNAASTASSLAGLSRVTNALSLATFITNPWVTWLIDLCNRLYLSVSPYLVALSLPRLF